MAKQVLSCTVNGERVEALVQPYETLLDALRERIGLTGPKEGCGTGDCGACTVHLDGEPVASCLVLALQARDRSVVTIEGLSRNGVLHPLLEPREGPRRQIVVITADKGLAGAFNANVLRRSLEFIRASNTQEVTLVVVGRKARDFYRRRAWTIRRDMLGFWDRLAYGHACELADHFMAQYLDHEVDEVHLIYNEFRSVTVQRPVRQQLLPIPQGEGAAEAGDVPLQGADRTGRGSVGPEQVDERVDGHGAAAVEREGAQQRPLLAGAEVDRS